MNTDDYEGHTPGPWWAEEQDREGSSSMVWTIYGPDYWIVMESDGCLRIDWNKQDALLAAAAPDLLQALIDERAEVKRLREQICTCDGDGIAGSAYAGHIRKCVCVEEEE